MRADLTFRKGCMRKLAVWSQWQIDRHLSHHRHSVLCFLCLVPLVAEVKRKTGEAGKHVEDEGDCFTWPPRYLRYIG